MAGSGLSDIYHSYIACLNAQDWAMLGHFVDDEVHHNGKRLGAMGYREMLEHDFREIPDLRFNVGLLVCEPPFVASRLDFDCTPVGMFLGLPVNGRKVSFSENVFYEFAGGRIRTVWSIIDKAAIEAQIR